MCAESRIERRRGKRIPLSFQVEVSGLSIDGTPFCDRALALDVSDRGCQLRLGRFVNTGDMLTLRVMRHKNCDSEQESPFLYQVVWVEPEKGFWAAGLEALEPGNPWRMTFPEGLVTRRRM